MLSLSVKTFILSRSRIYHEWWLGFEEIISSHCTSVQVSRTCILSWSERCLVVLDAIEIVAVQMPCRKSGALITRQDLQDHVTKAAMRSGLNGFDVISWLQSKAIISAVLNRFDPNSSPRSKKDLAHLVRKRKSLVVKLAKNWKSAFKRMFIVNKVSTSRISGRRTVQVPPLHVVLSLNLITKNRTGELWMLQLFQSTTSSFTTDRLN